ncbi:MAG: hypothetical protein ACRYHQ_11805 [Janthinobacterium lividum]
MTQTLQQRTFDRSVSLSDDAARFLAAERQIDEYGDASLTREAGEQVIAKLMALEREIIARMAATPGTRPADILAKAQVLNGFFDNWVPDGPTPSSCDHLVRSLLDDLLDPGGFIYFDNELLTLGERFDAVCAVAHAARSAYREIDDADLVSAATHADGVALRIAAQIAAMPATTGDGSRLRARAVEFVLANKATAPDLGSSTRATEEPPLVDAATSVLAPEPSDSALQSAVDDDLTVSVNLKLSKGGADAIFRAAAAEGTTQKRLITRALRRAGVPLPARDLEDRTPRRRY